MRWIALRNIGALVGHLLFENDQKGSRVAEAKQEQFERLYEQHFDRVAAYLLARSDRDSAADALARTFEVAWRRLDDIPADPLPWLLGVARRVLADGRRGQRRQDALVERLAGTVTESVESHADTLSRRHAVLSALSGLTPVQRETLLLVAWDGLSERQAATALGCTRGAIALRLHRARKQFRAALEVTASEAYPVGEATNDTALCKPLHPSTKEAT